ncbi:MAG TPA: type I DNA topoisomerase, partial [Candidatus Paceibacterota bacterium]|nr:type I DNA topoisomerase [Candidatus Paceibacterota bacterium]
KAFVPQEYWSITATLQNSHGAFEAELAKRNGETLDRLAIGNEAAAQAIVKDLEKSTYKIAALESKEVRKHPAAPFTTSTLQQTAAKRLGLSSKKTMFLAQQLYENGHITYMRTDSVNLSQEALDAAATWIKQNLPGDYALEGPRRFKNTSRLAQEAHEAIRPTQAHVTPDQLSASKDEQRLYELIWRRFIASQMPPAVLNAVHIDVEARTDGANTYILTANGSTMKFDGFLKVWPVKFEEKDLPHLAKDDALKATAITPAQHFTEPPPRYNEASLIKTLEQYGIGRPSTYAPTIAVILARNYVERQQGRFFPTEIGMLVNKVLTENFPEIVDVDFTAKMENELDDIAEGKEGWQKVIRDFYTPFAEHLAVKYEEVKKDDIVPPEVTDQICDKCGKPMVVKFGRFGKFLACSGFPDCKNTKTLKEAPKSSGVKCPKCLANEDRKNDPGELLERRVRAGRARGKLFWGCSKYPACDFAVWNDPVQAPPTWSPEDDAKKAERNLQRATRGKKKAATKEE